MTAFLWVFGVIAFYFLAAGSLLLAARLERDEDGNLVIDSNSWHFKVAYPYKRHLTYELDQLKRRGIGMCRYGAKLFFMTFVGWPINGIVLVLSNVLVGPAWFIFLGDLAYARLGFSKTDLQFVVEARTLTMPRISGERIVPVVFLLLAAYIWFWIELTPLALTSTIWSSIAVVLWVLMIGICDLFIKLSRGQVKTSLVVGWLSARKKKVCPIARVK